MELGELPAGWAWASIDDLVGLHGLFRDGDWVESKDQDPNGNVRLIQLADIGDGEFRDKSARFLTAAKAAELGCSYLQEGDLLVARMPDPLGRACLFPLKGEQKFVTVVDVCIVRFGHALIDNRYFLYALNSPVSRKRISDFQTGSTRKRISRGNLSTIEFPIPPLAEQHRIVAKIEELFSELDQGVASLKTAREQLKVYRQSLLKNAFEGKLTATWRAAHRDQLETAADLQQRIAREREARHQQQLADWQTAGQAGPKPKPPKPLPPLTAEELAELPELPAGWGWFKLAGVSDVSGGLTKNQKREQLSNTRPYLRVANVYANRLELEEVHSIGVTESELERVALENGDLLVVEGNGSIDQIGRVALWLGQISGCLHQNHIIKARPLKLANSKFLLYFLMSELGRKFIVRAASSTSGLHTLSISKVEGLFVPLCSGDEQAEAIAELESKLSEADQLDQTLATALQQADALRQSILKKAFSGQLVPQDPNDEPAAALLERIRTGKGDGPGKTGKRRKAG